LLTKQELSSLNVRSVRRAVELLAAGHLVTVFPTGGVMNAASRPWQPGLGTIIKLLATKNLPRIEVVLFRFEDFSASRIISSLLLQSYGLRPEPYGITLKVHAVEAADVLGDASLIRHLKPPEISERLRQCFIDGLVR
jgi:hypothetical protein